MIDAHFLKSCLFRKKPSKVKQGGIESMYIVADLPAKYWLLHAMDCCVEMM